MIPINNQLKKENRDFDMIWRCDLQPQASQYLEKLLEITKEVLTSGRYVLSTQLDIFEKAFASYLGVKHCVGVGNGTDALILALKVIGLSPGDEIITTPFTAIPTISAIVAAGGRPVFVDIDPDTFLIDIDQVSKVISDKTKAIVPVHLFSQMVDIERLQSLLSLNIPIIEDAAQAHGCSLRGRKAGTIGEMGAYSFYPTKNLGCYGDGGAIVTSNDEYARKLRLMRNYGKESSNCIILDGLNSRLDEIQAAFLSMKLTALESMNEKRRRIVVQYEAGLKNLPLVTPVISEGNVPNYHVYTIKVLEHRNELKDYLLTQNIQTDVFYPSPQNLQPVYNELQYKIGDFPIAEKVGTQVLSLPIYPELKLNIVDMIINNIRDFYKRKR